VDDLSFIPQITRRRYTLKREKVSEEAVFTVLNPRSSEEPTEFVGIAPRLDTLEGKKIGVVNLMGGNEELMESIPPDLMAAVPGCDVEYLKMPDSHAESAWDWVKSKDGIVLGHGY